MNQYNPYAAPQAAPPMPPGGPQYAVGGPQPWDIGEVFSLAWDVFKRSWGVLVGSYFLAGIIGAIPGQIPALLVMSGAIEQNSGEYWGIYSVTTFVGLVISSFFQPGLIRIWCAAARGQSVDFGTLFSGANKFLPVFATLMLTIFAILLGYVFLIVPGIILGLGLMFAQFFVVDADMGPIQAMKASWDATNGHKGKLFLFGLVGGLVAAVGLVACCIGVYASISLFWVALAIVYVRLSGRGTASAGYAVTSPYAGAYPAPPPGGYGGPPQGGGGGYGGPPQGGGGYGGPPPQGGGGYGGPPQGGGGGYGGPPPQGGGGYGGPPPQGGGGGYGGPPPQGGGGGYGGPQGGGGYGPPGA